MQTVNSGLHFGSTAPAVAGDYGALAVVKINKNTISEGSNPVMRYSNDGPVDYVLEVNGGFCDGENIKVGDGIGFDL